MKLFSNLLYTTLLITLLGSCSISRQLPGDLADTWYGFLPCADCPGISYTLKLETNGQYDLTMDYYDRDTKFTEQGKFTFENNKLHLYSDGKITSRFEREGNQLISLDAEGNRIQSDLAPYYRLYKGEPEKAEMPANFGRADTGLIYKGTGNEPFWLIKVTENNTLIFKGIMETGEIEFEIPVTESGLSGDNQSIEYSGKDKLRALEIRIINQPCQDGMSGKHFPTTLQVDLSLNGKTESLKGCGRFQNKYRLNGIWRLESINEKGINALSTPTLGIYLSDGRIAGNAGCNRFFGSVDVVTNQSVEFNQVGSTKMMCADMKVEDRYLKLFNQKGIKWEIDSDGLLHLSSNIGNFIFSRTEEL